ncbi:MAG TPA: DUF418 domain-containing protein, partial [Turneriella sp.]|nr:DUF418 domain-containing protein [Turneriella sp.]
MTEQAAPKRIEGLDALRGFALWGICVVNLPLIARSWDSYRQLPETASARGALFVNSLLFEAKFFTLFSFLYGIGIAVLQHREGTAFLLRRFLGLIVAGFLHAILLFPGDILLSYGLLGLFFLPLSRMHNRALLVTAIFCMVISGMTYTFLGVMSQANAAIPPTNYTTSYASVVASNLHVYPVSLGYVMLFNWPGALAMICLGYLAERRQWLAKIRLTAFSSLFALAGVTGSLLYASAASWQLKQYMPVGMLAMALTAPLLSLFYAQVILTLAEKTTAWLTKALTAAGRLSLTNYVTQSLLAGIIFHGYGFGLYNKLSYDGLFLVATGIYLATIGFSLLWLRYFSTGPLEWFLRSLSHWQLMPMRSAG